MPNASLTLQAPAKINLFLKVLRKRPDGFHDIYSLVQAVSLYDTLQFSRIESGIELTGGAANVPLDSSNIIWKAIELLHQETCCTRGVRVELTKRIPVGSGLGGGSSDAAAALKGVNRLLGLDLPDERLRELGARLGSDVPFFFSGGSALLSGRGDLVEYVNLPRDYHIILVAPDFAVSTALAYAQVKKYLTDISTNLNFNRAIPSEELFPLLKSIGNDFERLVTESHPAVSLCAKTLWEAGANVVALSGSGSAFFGLFDHAPDPGLETNIAERFGWRVFIVDPIQLE